MNVTDAMLEAHVRFELEQLDRRHLKKTVKAEVGAALKWLETVTLNDVASAEQVLDWVQRYAVALPVTDAVTAMIRDHVAVAYAFLAQNPTRVEEIIPRALFDQAVEVSIGLEDLRREITHQLVSSSVYSRLISDVLYHGIKGFVLTENVLARNIPGASSLVRFGQRSLNAASPKLEAGIDKQLIKFINANIQDTLAESERFLDKALDPTLIRKLGDEVWAANAEREMSELMDYVDADVVATVTDIAQDFWLHYRETALFHDLVTHLVHHFFAEHGDQSLRSLLRDLGITPAMIEREAYALAAPVVQKALDSGYLEQRLRQRLGAFYAEYHAQNGPAAVD